MAKKVPLIELQDVIKQYPVGDGDFYQALNGVNLTVDQGDFIAIMGPSGSGKSTMMHIMGALDTPTTGKQLFKGKDNLKLYRRPTCSNPKPRDRFCVSVIQPPPPHYSVEKC